MSTFLADRNKLSREDVMKITSDCLRQQVQSVDRIGGGGNSRVYHVACPSQEYVMKFYFRHPLDTRDRMGAEFKSFSFLWEKGLRTVPRPVAKSQEHHAAIYEFIKGTSPGRDIAPKDIDAAADFIEILKSLSVKAKGLDFPDASEACFCGQDIINSLEARLKRFGVEDNREEYAALKEYLRNDFLPLLEEVEGWSKKFLTKEEISWEQGLSQQQRTLSPSDFGFHNALRRPDGQIVFLDFEYFGWDDPAKLVSDFLWHPAMALAEDLKRYFVQRMSTVYGKDPDFGARLKGVFPLFGLKWCLILLNEFSFTDAQRRDFARQAQDKSNVRLVQLNKAKALSQKIKGLYKDFPYGF
jgi:hypothetical protein